MRILGRHTDNPSRIRVQIRGAQTSLRSTISISAESQIYPSVTLLEDIGGFTEEHQLMEKHEKYPGSLMIMKRYDPETQEDVHGSHGPPSMRGFETIGHTHTHGDSRARVGYEGTFVCVPGLVDLHVEVDPVIHPGSMRLRVYIGELRACIPSV
jgi:hypothetical protein